MDELERRLEAEHGPGTYLFRAIFCNGCGRSVSAPSTAKLALLAEGWEIGPYGGNDYCPRCRGR